MEILVPKQCSTEEQLLPVLSLRDKFAYLFYHNRRDSVGGSNKEDEFNELSSLTS